LLKGAVSEQSNPHPAQVVESSLGILLSHFTAVYGFVPVRFPSIRS
jgi:hypothetical protein